jgi:hypothetical protein
VSVMDPHNINSSIPFLSQIHQPTAIFIASILPNTNSSPPTGGRQSSEIIERGGVDRMYLLINSHFPDRESIFILFSCSSSRHIANMVPSGTRPCVSKPAAEPVIRLPRSLCAVRLRSAASMQGNNPNSDTPGIHHSIKILWRKQYSPSFIPRAGNISRYKSHAAATFPRGPRA